MTPAERAKAIRPDTFREELEAHLLHGFVLSTPDAFLMGRPIVKDAPHVLQADVWHVFPPAECDCWLVWLAAGDLAAIWRLVPYPLPWLAWARREGVLRFYRFDVFAQSRKNAPACSPFEISANVSPSSMCSQ